MAWEELEDETLDVVLGAYAPRPPGYHAASPPPATMATRVAARVRNNTLGELLHVGEEIEAEPRVETAGQQRRSATEGVDGRGRRRPLQPCLARQRIPPRAHAWTSPSPPTAHGVWRDRL